MNLPPPFLDFLHLLCKTYMWSTWLIWNDFSGTSSIKKNNDIFQLFTLLDPAAAHFKKLCLLNSPVKNFDMDGLPPLHYHKKVVIVLFKFWVLVLFVAFYVLYSAPRLLFWYISLCLCSNWIEVKLELLSGANSLSHLPFFCCNLLSWNFLRSNCYHHLTDIIFILHC